MFENLKQHYPFNNNFRHNMKTIALVSVGFIMIVLYFQPFGINFLSSSFYGYFVLIEGIFTALILFMNTVLLPGLLPQYFDSDRWTIKRELIYNLYVTAELAGVFAVLAYLSNSFGFPILPILSISALSLIPIIILNIINYNAGLQTKLTKAFEDGLHWLHEERKNKENQSKKKFVFRLIAENQKDFYEGNLANLIGVSSASNYVEIYWRDGRQIKKKLLRTRFSAVVEVLSKFKEVKQCHRCWLVNTTLVNGIKKQNQSYSLIVPDLDFTIPIARAQVPAFKDLFPIL